MCCTELNSMYLQYERTCLSSTLSIMDAVCSVSIMLSACGVRYMVMGGLCFLFLFSLLQSRSVAEELIGEPRAFTPPRGWNSYDSYSWVISEEQFLQNAEIVTQKLLPFGYEYVVVDFLWYRKNESGVSVTTGGFDVIDEWGRPIPDPARWPSSAGGKGFKPIADRVHSLGLKFGIHVMRGISTQAVLENTPILGAQAPAWRARDIALENQRCSWMPEAFMGVNETSEGGKAFIRSLYDLYASWGVDFVKHDCVFGVNDLNIDEITTVSQAIMATGRPMLYSISPGVKASPTMASSTHRLVNMYRITGDDWDSWNDLSSHFDAARNFAAAGLIGAPGLLGFSWPDLDMLPMGYLTEPGANHGPNRFTSLTRDEQQTQMTLWAMAKSPLMFGGDMVNIDNATLDVITNPVLLKINANSLGNMEIEMPNLRTFLIPCIDHYDCEVPKGTLQQSTHDTSIGKSDQLCWMQGHIKRYLHRKPWCKLSQYTASPALSLSRNVSGQLSACKNEKSCVDADNNTHYCISRSSDHKNQVWHIIPNVELVNNATKLCAILNGLNVIEYKNDVNIRVWRARGKQGEYYTAIFNLEEHEVDISLPLAAIVYKRSWGHGKISKINFDYQCEGHEVWSHEQTGILRGILPAKVSPHGCTLYILHCNF